MQREQRVVAAFPVEFDFMGKTVKAVSEDLSRHGIFIRTEVFFPIGEVVELKLYLPNGAVVPVLARVAHLLVVSAARSLGRRAGMGLQFLDKDGEQRARLREFVDEMIQELTPPPQELPGQARIVIADPSFEMRERLASALGGAGFQVVAAAHGAEAHGACLLRPPEAVLCSVEMPVLDGWGLIEQLAAHPRLSEVPVAMMSTDQRDTTRLRAYRAGVREYIPIPFTDEEIVIRLQRMAQPSTSGRDRADLRGEIAKIELGTLLSLLEYERKSGVLTLHRENDVAQLFLHDGRIMRCESTVAGETSIDRLMNVLDWKDGAFELHSRDLRASDEVGMGTQNLLIEHARIRDEENQE